MTTYQIKVQREFFKIQSTIYIYMYMYKPWALPPQNFDTPNKTIKGMLGYFDKL